MAAKSQNEKNPVDLSAFDKIAMRMNSKKKPCAIGFACRQLGDLQQSELEAACRQTIYGNNVIATWLEEQGHQGISSSAITSHRKRTCTCYV